MGNTGLSNRTKTPFFILTVVILAMLLFQCERNAESEISADISIFPESGNYNETITVRVDTILKNIEIRYTDDGSAPRSNSKIYKGALKVDKSTIIQAAAFDSDGNMVAGAGSVYLITPGNGSPTGVICCRQLEDGRSRFEVTATDPDNDILNYRWYVDGLLQPAATDPIFIKDLREENAKQTEVSVKIDDGNNTVEISINAEIAALPVQIDQELLAGLITGGSNIESSGPVNKAPELRMQAPYNMLEYGEQMRVNAAAADPEGDEIEYLWMIDDEIVQQGSNSFYDFSARPQTGRDFSIRVAVSDSINVKTAALSIYVNEKQPEAVIKSLKGKVEVLKNSGEWITARKGMALGLSDTLSTGFGAAAEVKLGDSILTVQAMSRVTLDALASSGGVQETSLFMRTGSVVASVDASEGAHDFEVMGPHATASVRGTQFSFDGLNLKVFEGKVALKMGPPQRNIQLNKQKARKPAEAEGELEESSEEGSSESEDASAKEESGEAEEAEEGGSDTEGEVLVETGESAEVDLSSGGTVVVQGADIGMDQFSEIQEISLPTHALVHVELKFQEVDTSSTISNSGQILMTGE